MAKWLVGGVISLSANIEIGETAKYNLPYTTKTLKKMHKPELLTPQEICDKYPNLKWKPNEIGTLLKLELLDGQVNRWKRITLICEDSVIRLAKYRNELLESKKFI